MGEDDVVLSIKGCYVQDAWLQRDPRGGKCFILKLRTPREEFLYLVERSVGGGVVIAGGGVQGGPHSVENMLLKEGDFENFTASVRT